MHVTLICGTISTGLHGRFDVDRLFEARALTGSESSFFNVARGLAERGHSVTVYCDAIASIDSCAKLAGARVRHIDQPFPLDSDAYISLSEPDQFRRLPPEIGGLRIVQQQLNDFKYCRPGFEHFVDIIAFLSPVHRDAMVKTTPQIAAKAWWIPNSVNLELYDAWIGMPRIAHSAAWCSSPDRGLHRMLEIWPLIRAQVPDATLNIFYRFEPWYEAHKDDRSKIGARARYIGAALRTLGRNGENGVRLVGPIPNTELAKILCQTDILPYTCDCIVFTEGFSVAVMDACAAGTIPIISNADALGDIYRNVARQVPGNVGDHRAAWVAAVVQGFTDEALKVSMRPKLRKFAEAFTRQKVAVLWETLIKNNLGARQSITTTGLPATIRAHVESVGQ